MKMTSLLSQALQSQDATMLRTILTNQDDEFIKNTIKKAPPTTIPLLVKALGPYFQASTAQCRTAIKWMAQIYLCHAATLMSNSDLEGTLKDIKTAMTCRSANATRLRQLRGRVDLLHDQVKMREGGVEDEGMQENEALTLVYADRDDALSNEDINSDYSEEEKWAEYQSESEKDADERMEDTHEESDDTSDSDMS